MPTWKIIHGSAFTAMAEIPDKSIHSVVSSPCYYGLRSYKTDPQTFGGDAVCEHEWSSLGERQKGGLGQNKGLANREDTLRAIDEAQVVSLGNTCSKCNAWRGDFGGEPRADCLAWARKEPPCNACYVCNTRTLFREIHRVLRDDGTVWWNLGDSYAGGGGITGVPEGWASISTGDREKYREGAADPKRNAASQGLKKKDLMGVPWRVALALQADGWYLRQDIVWAKGLSAQGSVEKRVEEACRRAGLSGPATAAVLDAFEPYVGNGMPQSVTDRCTTSHEYIFLLTKKPDYFFDHVAIRETGTQSSFDCVSQNNGNPVLNTDRQRDFVGNPQTLNIKEMVSGTRNRRSVWAIPTRPLKEAHFAAYPEDLVEPCILSGSAVGHTVLDPFNGSGTTGIVALQNGRNYIGIELSAKYINNIAMPRLKAALDVPVVKGKQIGEKTEVEDFF